MKRKDLIRLLEKNGWVFFREGGNHTTYAKNDLREQIPRHHEIDETLAKYIISVCKEITCSIDFPKE